MQKTACRYDVRLRLANETDRQRFCVLLLLEYLKCKKVDFLLFFSKCPDKFDSLFYDLYHKKYKNKDQVHLINTYFIHWQMHALGHYKFYRDCYNRTFPFKDFPSLSINKFGGI